MWHFAVAVAVPMLLLLPRPGWWWQRCWWWCCCHWYECACECVALLYLFPAPRESWLSSSRGHPARFMLAPGNVRRSPRRLIDRCVVDCEPSLQSNQSTDSELRELMGQYRRQDTQRPRLRRQKHRAQRPSGLAARVHSPAHTHYFTHFATTTAAAAAACPHPLSAGVHLFLR